ncbi:MAG TPA: DUF4097 family beta strand repeat-containing protein [Solirubrobacteraceae bacterium]|nr:DUF4097 family beta strand repeat-containing protein [Solirubrobacteraceae bacterium]
MKNLAWVVVLLLLIVAGAWALANFAFVQTKLETDTVYGTVREIVVKADRGDIDIVAASRLIQVRETRHWVVSQPELEQTRKNGVLTLESTCSPERVVLKCYSDLRIAVPRGVRVTVDADSGDVDLRGAHPRSVHVESDSGDIEMDLDGRQTLVFASSDSGDLDLIARSVRAVDAQTDAGDVTADVGGLPRRVVARSNSGDVDVTVPRGSYRIRAIAESGDATVSGLGRNNRALQSVHARTNDGDVAVRARAR